MNDSECENCVVCRRQAVSGEGIDESYEGERLHFCSPECQAKFEADPERYIGETQALNRPLGYT